jgi:hypothetical protein
LHFPLSSLDWLVKFSTYQHQPVKVLHRGNTNMMSTSTTPCNGASSTASKTPSITSTLGYEIPESFGLNDESGNIVDLHNVEDGNTNVNDCNGREINTCRSTSSGDWHSMLEDDLSVSSRREELASKESRAVTKLKLLVFGSLFCSMVAVALVAYFLTSQAEQDNFELKFHDDANKLLGNMGQNLQRTMEAADAFITSITSYAAHTNQTWPYVVIPDFAVRAEKVRSLCGAVYLNTYQFVEHAQRKEWENFTASVGTKMADEAIAAIADYNVMDWPITPNYTEWNVIYDYDEYDKENKVSTQQVLKNVLHINPRPHAVVCHLAGRGRSNLRWPVSSTVADSTHNI